MPFISPASLESLIVQSIRIMTLIRLMKGVEKFYIIVLYTYCTSQKKLQQITELIMYVKN